MARKRKRSDLAGGYISITISPERAKALKEVAQLIKDSSSKEQYRKAAANLLLRLRQPTMEGYHHVRLSKSEYDICRFADDAYPVQEVRQIEMFPPGVTMQVPAVQPTTPRTKPVLKTEFTEEDKQARIRAGLSPTPGDRPRDVAGKTLMERIAETQAHTREVEKGFAKVRSEQMRREEEERAQARLRELEREV